MKGNTVGGSSWQLSRVLKFATRRGLWLVFAGLLVLSVSARAAVVTVGDKDCEGFGFATCYATDPTTGATLSGLSANTVSLGMLSNGHGWPFPARDAADTGTPTDTIFVGSKANCHDGYCSTGNPTVGSLVFTYDYSGMVSGPITSFTLGIAADDFQDPAFHQPFQATVNGTVDTALTNQLNSLNLTGPRIQFFTIGIDPALLLPSNILTLNISEGGDGGDGYAIDFFTVGVNATSGIPEPGTISLLGIGLGAVYFGRKASRRKAAR